MAVFWKRGRCYQDEGGQSEASHSAGMEGALE